MDNVEKNMNTNEIQQNQNTNKDTTSFNNLLANQQDKFNFETTPIVDIVNDILITATKKGASDIHFDPAIDCKYILKNSK